MKHILSILLSFVALAAYAQNATVQSVVADPLNISASKYPMTDLNGHTAPLVIVRVLADNVEFKGSVLNGGVVRKTGEYWVYMGSGAKMLHIHSDKFLPVEIHFPDYGIPRLESSATYIVTLALPQAAPQSAAASHNYLVLNVSPADAKVTLDGQLQKLQNGTLRLLLRRNTTHDYLVEAPGYISEQGTVSIGAEKVERSIALRSTMGTLVVSTTTAGTDIYLNGEKTATGSWRGELMPGDYLVEGRLAGYRPAEQLVTITTGEQTSVSIPALAAITGSLNVDYRPDGAAITIDGISRGTTPNVLDGILAGTHRVTISAPGYASVTRDVTIADSELTTISGSLDPQAAPAQSTVAFSTTPVHLALCATGSDGRAVYITADQWNALSSAERTAYTPKGVCLSQDGVPFLVELHDKEKGKEMNWDDAMKYNLPTKEQGQILVKNKDALNNSLSVFGGTVMDWWYWTKTKSSSSTAWYVDLCYGDNGVYDYWHFRNPYRVRAVASVSDADSELTAISGSLDPQVAPAQSAGAFSTKPVHLALCATGRDGRAVYVTAAQWKVLSSTERKEFKALGVCISQDGETFLVELRDKENGKEMNWDDAMGYNLPTKIHGMILVNNRDALNNALKVFGGTKMDKRYWTKTEIGSSEAWNVGMNYGRISYNHHAAKFRVRAVAPAPVAR